MRRWLIASAIGLVACREPALRDDALDPLGVAAHTARDRAAWPERPALVRFHMQRHFDDLRAIERDLIAGQLDDAETLAYLLAQPPEPWMTPWQADTAHVQTAALAFAHARDLGEACRREPRIAAACAQCHADARRLPSIPAQPEQPDGGTTNEARAATHRWAIDRVWDGLVDAADTPWRRGLEVLAETQLPDTQLANAPALGRRLRGLARAQLDAPPPSLDDRSAAYGDLLVTCAACHAALGR